MNRSQFLATITALFTAPFIGKSKPAATKQEVEAWIKANPALLSGRNSPLKSVPLTGTVLEPPDTRIYGRIKGYDLVLVNEKESYKRGRIG